MPGVTQVNKLMTQSASSHDRKQKVKLINGYARRAQSQVSKVAEERRRRVREQVSDQGREVSEVEGSIDLDGEVGERAEKDGEEGGEEWEDDVDE